MGQKSQRRSPREKRLLSHVHHSPWTQKYPPAVEPEPSPNTGLSHLLPLWDTHNERPIKQRSGGAGVNFKDKWLVSGRSLSSTQVSLLKPEVVPSRAFADGWRTCVTTRRERERYWHLVSRGHLHRPVISLPAELSGPVWRLSDPGFKRC